MTTAQLKARLKQRIDDEADDHLLRRLAALLDLETAGSDLASRVQAGDKAIAEGRYRTPEEARATVQENIKRKYGK